MEEIVKVDQARLISRSDLGELIYADEDIVLLHNVHHLSLDMPALRVDMIMIVYCRQGKVQVTINGKNHVASEGNLVICNGLQVLSDAMFSTDFCCDFTCVSNKRFDEIIHSDHKVMDAFLYVNDNPVLELTPEEFKMHALYATFLQEKLTTSPHTQLTRVINGILTAAIFDFIGMIERQHMLEISKEGVSINPSIHKNDIVRQFLLMIVQDGAQHHAVKYFADRLCITPKYLSALCHRQTGKTPSQWIKEQQVEKIRTLLTTTTLTSKEIADRLNFTNLSFFGKFTRQHLGCSPMEYRKRYT